ncbi:ABC transporter substrate-binding protein [Frankia sp. AgB1.9]|nr:ABC transporter substrate-binding protein [Frankia sp. AgW1.1]MBL7553295.1 ABC transporter substrate-binding protein [Frankia sp. AgB1.9]MBL7624762.1 ABC transporter substrate-binding protein [Frankia sp. AgB1.8]
MRPRHTQRRIILLAAAAIVIAVTGCSTASKSAPTASPTVTLAAPPAPPIAPGVTADSIKIGFVFPDLSVVKQYIHIDHGDYKATFQALIDKVNAAGGIDGRKIIPVYGAVNVLSPAGASDTCVHLTQDEKVFAVLGSLNADDVMCYVQTHKTAVVGGDLTAQRYAKAQAPWFSDSRDGDQAGDGIKLFAADNALAGKKVAVIGYAADQNAIKTVVSPALNRLGITPVSTAILDAPLSDPAAVAQQTGVFIQRFQSAGADNVIVVGGASTEFPAQLEKTSYRPRLLFTDVNQAEAYTTDSSKHDFSTVRNAEALGVNTNDADPSNLTCINTVESAIPSLKGKILASSNARPGSPTPVTSERDACSTLAIFMAIAEKAGKNLTYQTFEKAGFALGSLHIPAYVDTATYSQNTPAGQIPARLFTYNPATGKFDVATR